MNLKTLCVGAATFTGNAVQEQWKEHTKDAGRLCLAQFYARRWPGSGASSANAPVDNERPGGVSEGEEGRQGKGREEKVT